jgi:hypothetical protein
MTFSAEGPEWFCRESGLGPSCRQHSHTFLRFYVCSCLAWRVWRMLKRKSQTRHPAPASKTHCNRSRFSPKPRPNGGYGEYGGTIKLHPFRRRRGECFRGAGHSAATPATAATRHAPACPKKFSRGQKVPTARYTPYYSRAPRTPPPSIAPSASQSRPGSPLC